MPRVNKFKLRYEAVPCARQHTLCPHPVHQLNAGFMFERAWCLVPCFSAGICVDSLLFWDLIAENAVNAGPNENQGLLSVCITCQPSASPLPLVAERQQTAQRPRALPRNAVEPSQSSQSVCVQSITGQPPSITFLAVAGSGAKFI